MPSALRRNRKYPATPRPGKTNHAPDPAAVDDLDALAAGLEKALSELG